MRKELRTQLIEAIGTFAQGDPPTPKEELFEKLKSGLPDLMSALREALFEDGIQRAIEQFVESRARATAEAGPERQLGFAFMPPVVYEPKSETWSAPERLPIQEFKGLIDWRAKTIQGRAEKLKLERKTNTQMREMYRDAKSRAGGDLSLPVDEALALPKVRKRRKRAKAKGA